MLILGLTGGIATGKSTASRILHQTHNLPIIDADVLAREVVAQGTRGYRRVVAEFLPSTPDLLQPDGSLNRTVLGRRIFGDEPARKKLNAIVHPAVRRAILAKLVLLYVQGYDVAVVDVPLLFESGLDRFCQKSCVVSCVQETQRRRLRARDPDLTQQDAQARIASQMDMAEKRRRANCVLQNDGSVEELAKEIQGMMERIRPSRARTLAEWMAPYVVLVGLTLFLRPAVGQGSQFLRSIL